MRPIAFGEALPAGTWLTLFSNDKPDRFFTVIKFWTDQTLAASLVLRSDVPCYQVEDEEGRTHLLIHLSIEERRKTDGVSGGRITQALIRDRSLKERLSNNRPASRKESPD